MSDEYAIHTNFQAGQLNEQGYWHEMKRLAEARKVSGDTPKAPVFSARPVGNHGLSSGGTP